MGAPRPWNTCLLIAGISALIVIVGFAFSGVISNIFSSAVGVGASQNR